MILLLFFFFLLPVTVDSFCYYGTAFTNETGCFQFFRTPLNFTNAVRFCRVNLKSTLTRPTSSLKNRQIQEAAVKLGIEEYWIGATNVDNDWEWLDGSLIQYSNFDVASGYPKKTESQIGAVSMDSLSGLWYTKLDAMALPFVCEFKQTDEYDQGILYRVPKTQSLRFPHGGEKAPILLVQSTDQSALYPSVGPFQNEPDTGEKVYMKPIPGFSSSTGNGSPFSMSGQPIIMVNPRKRVRVKPVIVSQTETELTRNLKEKEETEDNLNVKSSGNGTTGNVQEELSSNSKAKREREENEVLKTKTINIQRGKK